MLPWFESSIYLIYKATMKRASILNFYIFIIITFLTMTVTLFYVPSTQNANLPSPLGQYAKRIAELLRKDSDVLWVNMTYDRNRLHLIQTRLQTCVHSDEDILKCLEEAYRRERQQHTKNETGKVNEQKGNKKPSIINAKGKKPLPVTDDPIRVQQFYDRSRYVQKVNEYKYDYLLTPNNTCDQDTYMVILVHSFHTYNERRRAIRSTWGGAATGHHPWPAQVINKKMKLFFVLGIHPKASLNTAIAKEGQQYDDILQGNFVDAYTNMTLKSLLGLKYVSEYCKKVKYLLKSDDDMMINIPYLLDILAKKNMTRGIIGPLNQGSKVAKAGKWKVSKDDFPLQYYPPYEAGSAYVISNDIVAELYNMSHYVRHFHVDDAYVTGVLGKLIGVRHVKQQGFAYWTNKAPKACDIVNNLKVTGTKMTPVKLKEMWQALTKHPKCS